MIGLLVGTLVMLFTTFVLLDAADDKVTNVTQGIAEWATPKNATGGG